MTNEPVESSVSRIGGVAAILSAMVFFSGVALQVNAGWFPEEALLAGSMDEWMRGVTEARRMALTGVGLGVLGASLWGIVALVLYSLLRAGSPGFALVGLSGHMLGIPLALSAFSFALGATWGLVDGGASAPVAEALMRGFLVSDDWATFLIVGWGNGCFSLAALRSGTLPRWVAYLGIVTAVLVTLVLLRYLEPIFAIASIGYPLGMIWFIVTGVVLLRRSRDRPEAGATI